MVFASFDSLKLKRSTRNIHAMMDITNLKLCLTIKKVNSYEMSIIILMLSHTLFFFYKNLFYKNVEAEIDPNFKNVLRTFLRLRVD